MLPSRMRCWQLKSALRIWVRLAQRHAQWRTYRLLHASLSRTAQSHWNGRTYGRPTTRQD